VSQNVRDPAPWAAFVSQWRTLRVSPEQPEQAIREQILAPMLTMLGYGLRTVHDILYEHVEPLPDEYRMLGSRRIKVDYVPTLRLQRFWIMEAKKPGSLSDTAANKRAFLQAHFYATYPTINARYIVLADGEQLRVYDARSTSLNEARLVVVREMAEANFGEFYALLAARHLLDAVRRDVLSDMERVLSKEIDVNAPRAFSSAMAEVTQRVTPIIKENVRQLIVTHHQTKVASRASYLQTADLRTILAVMSQPTEVGFDTSNELARRLVEGDETKRRSIVSELMIVVAGPVRQTVRVSVMRALLLAAASRTTTDWKQLLSLGVSLARENLAYAVDKPFLNATLHFENASDRVAMKLTQHFFEESAAQAERMAHKTMALEDLLKEPPSKNVPLILGASGLTLRLADALRTSDSEVLLKRIRALERFERLYLPQKPPHLSGDQINLASKGVEPDFLIRATVDALYQIIQAAPGLLPDDLAQVGAGWETFTFPRTPSVPDGDFDLETFAALEAVFKVLQQSILNGNAKPDDDTTANDHGKLS
jgi:hypothetical protein